MTQKIWTDQQRPAKRKRPVAVGQLSNGHANKLRAAKSAIGAHQVRKQMKALRAAAKGAR